MLDWQQLTLHNVFMMMIILYLVCLAILVAAFLFVAVIALLGDDRRLADLERDHLRLKRIEERSCLCTPSTDCLRHWREKRVPVDE